MNKTSSWSPIINKFRKRLSKWKASNLSYGGRLTLIKSVLGGLGTYYFSCFKAPKKVLHILEKIRRNFFWGGHLNNNKISWIAWNKVCYPKNKGGLGIGSLLASNLAMLTKWWWRFKTDQPSLWKDIVKAIHGEHGGLEPHYTKKSNTWGSIARIHHSISIFNVDLWKVFLWKVGNGRNTSFWHDKFADSEFNLKTLFPRLFHLDSNKLCKVADRIRWDNGLLIFNWAWERPLRTSSEAYGLSNLIKKLDGFTLVHTSDSWTFSLAGISDSFSVHSMRSIIDLGFLNSHSDSIQWNKVAPLKININSWRIFNNRLPTRDNLINRNIDIHSSRCAVCDEDLESAEHLFVQCSTAIKLWELIRKWWSIANPTATSTLGILRWADTCGLCPIATIRFDVVIQATLWVIWKNRNCICFQNKPTKPEVLFDNIVLLSFDWVSNRSKNSKPKWPDWIL